jgi:hypothetical protein
MSGTRLTHAERRHLTVIRCPQAVPLPPKESDMPDLLLELLPAETPTQVQVQVQVQVQMQMQMQTKATADQCETGLFETGRGSKRMI